MRVYYNKITMGNFALLKTLQDQLLNAYREQREESLILSKVTKESKKITEPMESDQSDAAVLSRALESYVEERETLRASKSQLSELNNRLKDLKWRHELLLQKLLIIQKERDVCNGQFLASIYQSQQQNELRNLLLEKQLLGLMERGEQQTATLSNILMRGNFNAESVRRIQSQITDVVQMKTDQICDLEKKLSQTVKAKENLEKVMQEAQHVQYNSVNRRVT